MISGNLTSWIADKLSSECSHASLPSTAHAVGFDIPIEGGGGTKRERVLSALEGKANKEIGSIAHQVGARYGDFNLDEAGLALMEDGEPPITEITRRDVGKYFGFDLSGELDLLTLLRKIFPIDSMGDELFPLGIGDSLAKQIHQHMVRNPEDWSVEYLFEQLGALNCSRRRFALLIEATLHPLCRRGATQSELADGLSEILRRDGYHLVAADEQSGYPIYRLQLAARGVKGAPKNLIFASAGPKPEIGFRDAINNDIVILSNEKSCLIYDRPIAHTGLLWSELVAWWSESEAIPSSQAASSLGARLQKSLGSKAEERFFSAYFKVFRHRLGEALPALIPQVYLHYDPEIVRLLRHRDGLKRQRMDFLMLLPDRRRVVIEVDGPQHFSHGGQPNLAVYAEMVSADRDLRLAGYEVYRFGANELDPAPAVATVTRFFDSLLKLK